MTACGWSKGGGRHNVGRVVAVSKVGRKWVSLVDAEYPTRDAGRYDKTTMAYDNGGYSGGSSIYGTEADWLAHVRLAEAWQSFRQQVSNSYVRPNHLTIANINMMTRILQSTRVGEGGEG